MTRYRDRNMGNWCASHFRAQYNPNRARSRDDRDRERLPLTESSSLSAQKIDFMIDINCAEHNTEQYEVTKSATSARLVIRRGATFKLGITFHRNYKREDDIINLVFTVKDTLWPSYSQNTEIVIPVNDDHISSATSAALASMEGSWSSKVIGVEENKITFQVSSSGSAIVGEWNLRIETKSKEKGGSSLVVNKVRQSLFILFNPWSKKDSCYLKDKEGRKEFVLNDSGIIWRGIYSTLKPVSWNYAQFEKDILECCCYLMSKVGKLSVTDRADPIKVSRHISAIVNSVDDNGIMLGNWSGTYAGGKAPSSWAGSMVILQQFHKTKKPVKFGQCWVFAGLSTTVCRCLGIPSRTVTNYQSAHDTHSSLTVDRFFTDDLEAIDEKNIDSIWNFHAWTEAWMTRPDLSSAGQYDGWQVIDPTPQEPSDGLFRCGPASVEAVKRGEVLKPYDTKFVYAEVNADEVFWLHQGETKPLKLLQHKTTSIGKKMSTKSMGSSKREEITDNYKHQERTIEEREVMLKALRLCKNQFSRFYLNEKFEDIRFELVLIHNILIGSPFTVRLKLRNKSGKVYTVSSIIIIRSTLYTGLSHKLVKKSSNEAKVAPKSDEEIVVDVSYSDYDKNIIDQGSFNVSVMAKVLENDFQYYAMDEFRVRMPDIKLETEGDIIQGKPFTCIAFFDNPLPKPLTKAYFTVEGPGLGVPLRLPLKGPVPANSEARVTFALTPKSAGEKTISARFISRELSDVDGFKNVRVAANLYEGEDNYISTTIVG